MEKKVKRDVILYSHIQSVNDKWIKSEMKRLGYSTKRGKSEFIDNLITEQRAIQKSARRRTRQNKS